MDGEQPRGECPLHGAAEREALLIERPGDGRCREVLLDMDERTVALAAYLPEVAEDARACFCGYEGDVRLDDAGLFPCDPAECAAKVLLMVEADVCDDGNFRRDDIGCVEAAAHAGFDDGGVNLLPGKKEKCKRSGELEECGREPVLLGEGAYAAGESGELAVRYLLPADPDTLAEADEVGAGVEADAHAGCLEDARGERGGGALAVGACNVDAPEFPFGVAQELHQPLHCFQPQPDAEALEAVEVAEGFVGHR